MEHVNGNGNSVASAAIGIRPNNNSNITVGES